MKDLQRCTLAEFSRIYFPALGSAPAEPKVIDRTETGSSPEVCEKSFAAQVVLGMSKNRQQSEAVAVRLIG
jgi:hypothetical protein